MKHTNEKIIAKILLLTALLICLGYLLKSPSEENGYPDKESESEYRMKEHHYSEGREIELK